MLTIPPAPTKEATGFASGAGQKSTAHAGGTLIAGPDHVWNLARPAHFPGTLTAIDLGVGTFKVQTAFGTLTVDGKTPLLVGANLTAEVTPGDPPSVTLFPRLDVGRTQVPPPEEPAVTVSFSREAATALNAAAPLSNSAQKWSGLTAVLPILENTQSALAEAIRLAIPQAGPLLAPIVMMFVAGLRRGSVRDWLGETILEQLREAGRTDLASTLETEFASVARHSTAETADGWHAVPVPLWNDGQLEQMQLFLRREREPGSENATAKTPDIRFVIDAEPRATGPIQLDGLVHQTVDRATTINLAFRHQRPLTAQIRSDVMQVYSNALAVTGLTGGLTFQSAVDWIKIGRERGATRSMTA